MYPFNNIEGLQNLNELVSLQYQVQQVNLQDELGKEKFHDVLKKLYEPMSDIIENTSQDKTKTITETSIKNNKVLESLNEKTCRGMIAPFSTSSLVNHFKPENKSKFRVKRA